ncbi:unnamed protein product, partial [marine sediment metagenome]
PRDSGIQVWILKMPQHRITDLKLLIFCSSSIQSNGNLGYRGGNLVSFSVKQAGFQRGFGFCLPRIDNFN